MESILKQMINGKMIKFKMLKLNGETILKIHNDKSSIIYSSNSISLKPNLKKKLQFQKVPNL